MDSESPVFRMATLGDLAAINEIEVAQFEELAYPYFVLRQLFDLYGAGWVVVETAGRIRGYALVAFTFERCAWVIGFVVTPEHRRRGFGTRLLERALDECRVASARRVFITVRPTNQSAYDLYMRAGFVWTAHEDGYFGAGEPRDVLVHRLGRPVARGGGTVG